MWPGVSCGLGLDAPHVVAGKMLEKCESLIDHSAALASPGWVLKLDPFISRDLGPRIAAKPGVVPEVAGRGMG